jgi:hypothetical protein
VDLEFAYVIIISDAGGNEGAGSGDLEAGNGEGRQRLWYLRGQWRRRGRVRRAGRGRGVRGKQLERVGLVWRKMRMQSIIAGGTGSDLMLMCGGLFDMLDVLYRSHTLRHPSFEL